MKDAGAPELLALPVLGGGMRSKNDGALGLRIGEGDGSGRRAGEGAPADAPPAPLGDVPGPADEVDGLGLLRPVAEEEAAWGRVGRARIWRGSDGPALE